MAYSAIEIEGLFPADLLERIAIGDGISGQAPIDFGLPATARLTDELQSAYSDVRAHWDAFQRRLAHSRTSPTTITREAWADPFLERLGYTLIFQRATTIDGESFVISHRAGEVEDAPPVNVVSIDQELDARIEGSRRTPHAAVQEYLNRTDVVWGIVTNGERLRLLRNAARISQPTYLEFDLGTIIEDNLYSEFVLLYRLIHRTRLPRSAADTESWIERYYQQGLAEGGRVRERLRDGVERAITELANGLLTHRSSDALRQRVTSGDLQPRDLYRQLLRLVYRLLFLMVVEERKLVVPAGSPGSGPDIYLRHYGVGGLRERADRYIAPDTYADLWLRLVRVFAIFREESAATAVGLRALDGELFSAAVCADLEGAGCANDTLLRAIRALSTFDDGGVRRLVNFAGLDVEELGSVYESLLDYAPRIDKSTVPPRFVLELGAERRSTGSYYTPQSLVHELVEAALVPVMKERVATAIDAPSRERALLGLRVLDLASGSGHFLLAAGRRIARELAKVRAAGNEPSPTDFRHALREVIRSCLYAVDKNPLAVDLCKVALWIESHEAGLPLAFLDHRVKLGDSLVGVADLTVLDDGIPDVAYERADPSLRARGRAFRDRNRTERLGQLTLVAQPPRDLAGAAAVVEAIVGEPDDSTQRVHEHATRYANAREAGGVWWRERVACDLWTAPFFSDLHGPVPTTGTLHAFRASPDLINDDLLRASVAAASADGHRALHWPVEFPDVAAGGGFDVILSNPPFMGGQKISTSFGENYRRYVLTAFPPAGGTADLCAFFFRRAYGLLSPRGRLGMIGTKTLHEGDSRDAGLRPVVEAAGVIVNARRSVPWPGEASVQVDVIAIARGLVSDRVLDGVPVGYISSRLDDEPEAEAKPLAQNSGKAFQGSIVLGLGFILDPLEADALIARDPRNRDCLFPFLNGDDLNSRADQSPSRWVINFFDWPLDRATQYPALLRIVETKVRPERERLRTDVQTQVRRTKYWWQYGSRATTLYGALPALSRVLVRTIHSELHLLAFVPTNWIYDHALVVFAFDDDYHFAVLQSNIHEAWVRRYSSNLESRNRYTPTDCFENFPFPQDLADGDRTSAERVARDYDEHRSSTMRSRRLGLTKTYSLVNDERCLDSDIRQLRELHAGIDRGVAQCYGWSDIDLDHGFYPNEREQSRFTISPGARRELLHRLLALNEKVAREEREAAG